MQPKSASRRARGVPRRRGRRPALLRERGDPARRAGEEVDYVDPRRDDPDRDPGRGHHRCGREPRGCAGVPRLPLHARRPALFAEGGYRPVDSKVLEKFEDTFPTPPSLFTIDDLGGWETSPRSSSIRRAARSPRSSATWENDRVDGLHRRNVAAARSRGRDVGRPSGARAVPWRGGPVAERDRADPADRRHQRARVHEGLGAFWDTSRARSAGRAALTLLASLVVVAINVVMGTIIAWVLVRDEFPGKRFVNSLIDLPFALPTIVAGLTLLTLYGGNGPVGSTSRSRSPGS